MTPAGSGTPYCVQKSVQLPGPLRVGAGSAGRAVTKVNHPYGIQPGVQHNTTSHMPTCVLRPYKVTSASATVARKGRSKKCTMRVLSGGGDASGAPTLRCDASASTLPLALLLLESRVALHRISFFLILLVWWGAVPMPQLEFVRVRISMLPTSSLVHPLIAFCRRRRL